MNNFSDWDDNSDHFIVSKTICRIGKSITDKQKKNEDGSIEIEQLKTIVMSKNAFASLVACKTFVLLNETSCFEANRVTALLLPMLKNSSFEQFTSIVESLFEISLIQLKRKCSKSSRYICHYKIISAEQHPLLPIFTKDILTIPERQSFILDQIEQALNHPEKLISENSTEYLKAILFYIFNYSICTDSLWKLLLFKSREADLFYQNIILFSRSDCSSNELYINNLILKATKYFMKIRDNSELQSLSLCLIVSTTSLAERGISVKTPIKLLYHLFCDFMTNNNFTGVFTSLSIMLFADLLQIVSPYETFTLIKLIKTLIIDKSFGTSLALYMVLDGLTQKLSCSGTDRECALDIEDIFCFVALRDNNKRFYEQCSPTTHLISYVFFHDRIAAYYEFDVFVRSSSDIFTADLMKQIKGFNIAYPLIARGLFLSNQLRYDAWLEIYSQLTEMNKKSKKMQNTWRMPFLYKISNEMHPKTKNLLLKSLPDFGKDAVVNTITCLAKTTGKAYAIDLYFKLWLLDSKTFSGLCEALKENSVKTTTIEEYENQIAKAFIIKQICAVRPSQHGSELIQQISELLNTPSNEIVVVLALESLGLLCENAVVDIMSTWNEISFKFRYENRVRILKSLFVFFSKIPKLYQKTNEYTNFTREIIKKLWLKALYNIDNDVTVCGAAIDCLALFPKKLLFLDDIPDLLKKGFSFKSKADVEKKDYDLTQDPCSLDADIAAPEVWINLMENTYRQCIENVASLISNIISEELQEFRGGIYVTPEGRSEPKDFKNLPEKSILRAIIQFLLQQSKQQTADDHIICGLLKSLAFKFPKPLPPLDWNFLHEFFHNSIDLKHNCIRILCGQMFISKTAKQMIENYIRNFDVTNFQEEDIGILYEKLSELTEHIDEAIYIIFIKKSILFSQGPECSSLLFDHIVASIPTVLNKSNLELKVNTKNLCEFLEETMISMETLDETFYKFLKLIKYLPLKTVNKVITNGLQSKSQNCFKKSLILIKAACSENCASIDNPLNWLIQAIEQTQNKLNLQLITLEAFIDIFSTYQSSKICGFVTELLNKIQNSYKKDSQAQKESLSGCISINKKGIGLESSVVVLDNCYLIDVFITCVISLSGNAFLIRNSMENETDRTLKRCFPHSLCNLLQHEAWIHHQSAILETLFKCYQNKDLPELYADMCKNAIICCKNLSYFDQQQIWHRFILICR